MKRIIGVTDDNRPIYALDSKKHNRTVTVQLGADIVEQVYAYKEAFDLPNAGAAIELLVRQSLAVSAETGAVRGAYLNALDQCQRWTFDRLKQFFTELQTELKG